MWRTVFQTRAEAREALARSIDGFYNPLRRHSALGFLSPAQFERQTASQTLSTEAEPYRVFRRLLILEGWSHDQAYSPVFS